MSLIDSVDANGLDGGVEESAVISLHQHAFSSEPLATSKAILIDFSPSPHSLSWDIADAWNNDTERQRYHLQKMQSKNVRANEQLKRLNIPCGKVFHLLLST